MLAVVRAQFHVGTMTRVYVATLCGQAIWYLDFIVPVTAARSFTSGVLLSYFLDPVVLLVLVLSHVAVVLKLLPLLA